MFLYRALFCEVFYPAAYQRHLFFLVDAKREYRGCPQVNQSAPLQQTSGARFFAHLMFYFTVPSFEDVYPVAHADIYSFFLDTYMLTFTQAHRLNGLRLLLRCSPHTKLAQHANVRFRAEVLVVTFFY
jgi:hypothetical protein